MPIGVYVGLVSDCMEWSKEIPVVGVRNPIVVPSSIVIEPLCEFAPEVRVGVGIEEDA